MPNADVHNNEQRGQYELSTAQGLAFAQYQRVPGAVRFTHTEVPEAMEGQGVGSRLVKAALDDVRAHGQKVIPDCPFVAGYIQGHQEYQDLLER